MKPQGLRRKYLIQLLILISFSCLLMSCSESTTSIPDLTPVLWEIDDLQGFGRAFLEGDSLYGYTRDQNKAKQVNILDQKVSWHSEAITGYHSWDTWVVPYKDFVYTLYTGQGLKVYKRNAQNSDKALITILPPNKDETLIGGAYSAGLLIKQDKLYLLNGKGLFVYNIQKPESPGLLWQYVESTENIFSLDIDAAENVYLGTQALGKDIFNLFKLDASGQELWKAKAHYTDAEFQRGSQYPTALKLDGDKLYAAVPEAIHAYDTETGERLWVSDELPATCEFGGGDIRAFELGDQLLYTTPTFGGCIHAYNKKTGKAVWTVSTSIAPNNLNQTHFGGKPLLHKGILYAANTALWAVDARTGKVLSISKDFNFSQETHVQFYNGEILTWGDKLMAYKPVR